jgi:Flp pilus assembly protein TadD
MNCHSEQTSGWAAAAVKQWHGAGTNERAEFANAIAAARRGFANDELRNEMFDAANPGMARATALSLLAPPFTEDDYRAIQDGLGDPDPLLRLAALRVHGNTPAEFRLQFGTDLLDDRIRGVRLEAARTFADIRDYLPQGARSHYEAANRELVHSFEISADRPESHAGLGGIAASNGNLDGAASHYQRAISMAPEFGLARINLSDVYRRLGDEEAGATVLREGLRLVPDDATLRHSYGLLLVRLQRHDEGLVELQEAVRLAPDNARFGYVLAVAYYSLEQRDAAVELIQRLAQQHPNNPDIQGLLQSLSAN